MSSPSESMLALLPQPLQPIPGDSFNDRILLLLAAVATSDGLLTYREYQLVQEAASAIFGERAFHAELQAKLHHALLHPPANPAEIARSMAHQAEVQKVSASFVDSVLKALASIGAHAERIDDRSRSLMGDIELAFRNSDLRRAGFGLGVSVSESLGGLYRLATGILPSRRELGRWFAPETSVFNADMNAFVTSLERIAWTLNDTELRDELHALRKMLHEQPFKIVAVGERKRGKSSVINAIIGQELSPIRESTPETATVVAFHYAPTPDYSVQFLDSSQFAQLETYLENEEDNLLLVHKIERIRKGVKEGSFIPGRLLSGITCWDELPDYISVEGRFAGMVARVDIGLPLDMLRAGVVIVDTPGLNDTDRFHDYLSYEESLEADCILFVMDARDPGSHSELSLLRKLARSGRSVTIIGILTNTDRLNYARSLEAAREQAKNVLQEACRTSSHVELAGIVAINARRFMEERCREHRLHHRLTPDPAETDLFLEMLRDVMDRDRGKTAYRHKVTEACLRVTSSTREHIQRYMDAYRASLPGEDLLAMLDVHANQLASTAMRSLEQARQVVNAAARDLEGWDVSTEQALQRFQETLVLRIMDAVNRRVSELGHRFAKDSEWHDFDTIDCRNIARQAVDEFLEEQRGALKLWEDKLRLFSDSMDTFSKECLERLSASIEGLQEDPGEAPSSSSTATHFLVQTHRHMRNLAVFTTGMSVGRLTALGPISLLVTAGNILALAAASPVAAAVFAAVAGTAGLLYHLGREERRKSAFLDRRRKETELYADRIVEALRLELGEVREELGKAYEFEIKRGFAPALESLFQQSVHLRLFLEVMQKIRSDATLYDKHVQTRLQELETMQQRYQNTIPATPRCQS